MKRPHWQVTLGYGLLQLLIGLLMIAVAGWGTVWVVILFVTISLAFLMMTLTVRRKVEGGRKCEWCFLTTHPACGHLSSQRPEDDTKNFVSRKAAKAQREITRLFSWLNQDRFFVSFLASLRLE